MTLDGKTDDRFKSLTEILERQLEADYDLGASMAVAVDGEIVLDVWGGFADEERTKPRRPTPSPTSGQPPRQ